MIIDAKKFELVAVGTGDILEEVYAPLMTNEILEKAKGRHPGKEIFVRKCDNLKKVRVL